MKDKNCFSVQYHPEASPGPHDSSIYLISLWRILKKLNIKNAIKANFYCVFLVRKHYCKVLITKTL